MISGLRRILAAPFMMMALGCLWVACLLHNDLDNT